MGKESRYRTITKVSNEDFVRYHTDDMLDFVKFLDKDYPNWRYINVFLTSTGVQVGSFTKYRRPQRKQPF